MVINLKMKKIQKDENRITENLKLIVKSSFIVFIGLFLSKLFFYLYRLLIARFFGPEEYGVFSLAFSIFLFFALLFTFGLDKGLLRFISFYRGKNETDKIRHLISFSERVLFISSLSGALILFLLAESISINLFHNSELLIFLRVFSFVIPLYIFSTIFLSVIRAYEKIGWYSFIFNILQNLIKPISLIILVFLGFGLISIPYSYFLGILAMLVASYLFYRINISNLFQEVDKRKNLNIKKEFINYSVPLMFFGVINLLFFWIDSFSIGYFLGVYEVGIYNAAVPLVTILGFFPETFIQLFFPIIIKEYSKNNFLVIKELSKQISKWIFIFNLPIFIILFLFPGAIINILFGSEYITATNSLRILSIGTFFACSTIYISDNLLSMKGKSKLILINIIVAAILNIIFNFFLVPKYGINGAALATSIVHVLLGTAIIIETKYYLSIVPIKRKMLNILLISFLPTILLLYLRKIIPLNIFSIFLLGVLFLLLYILLILLTNCLDKNDFMILKNIINFKGFNRLFQS